MLSIIKATLFIIIYIIIITEILVKYLMNYYNLYYYNYFKIFISCFIYLAFLIDFEKVIQNDVKQVMTGNTKTMKHKQILFAI